MSKRILVSRNESEIEKSVNCLNEHLIKMDVVKKEFESLNIGSFTNEVYKKLLTDKGENAVKQYYDNVNEELDKIGVKNEVTRNALLKEHESLTNVFKENVKTFLNNYSTANGIVDFNNYEFQNNKFVIPAEAVETIKENNSYYISDKKDIALYIAIKELLTAMQNVKGAVNDLTGYDVSKHVKTIEVSKLFITEYGSLEMVPDGIRTFKHRYQIK